MNEHIDTDWEARLRQAAPRAPIPSRDLDWAVLTETVARRRQRKQVAVRATASLGLMVTVGLIGWGWHRQPQRLDLAQQTPPLETIDFSPKPKPSGLPEAEAAVTPSATRSGGTPFSLPDLPGETGSDREPPPVDHGGDEASDPIEFVLTPIGLLETGGVWLGLSGPVDRDPRPGDLIHCPPNLEGEITWVSEVRDGRDVVVGAVAERLVEPVASPLEIGPVDERMLASRLLGLPAGWEL